MKEKRWLLWITLAGLALRFAAWFYFRAHTLLLVTTRLPDDALYYFTIARNLAHGYGMSFDGIHPTNGMHPLWLLLITPIFALHLTQWGFIHAALLLQTALDAQVVTLNDIRFGTDETIWLTMNSTNNSSVWKVLSKIHYCVDNFYLSNAQQYDLFTKGKFRGINPWVKRNGSFYRLTEIDPEFKASYDTLKDTMQHGWYIKYQ